MLEQDANLEPITTLSKRAACQGEAAGKWGPRGAAHLHFLLTYHGAGTCHCFIYFALTAINLSLFLSQGLLSSYS